jgi:hypothetical protein
MIEWSNGPVKYMASRPSTAIERQEWRDNKSNEIESARLAGEDTFSIAFDDGGESRLPPRSISVPLPVDRIYIVQRARCRVELGWGNATGGMTKILDTKTGEHAYVPRKMLKIVTS